MLYPDSGKESDIDYRKAEETLNNNSTIKRLSSLRSADLRPLSQLHNLVELDLLEMTLLEDAELIAIATANPGLERLCIESCEKITDKALAVLAEKCPRITHLNVAKVTELREGLTGFTQLVNLEVFACIHLTDKAISDVSEHAPSHHNTQSASSTTALYSLPS